LAEVVYLIEKNRLPPSAYDELTQALADPEHVFTEAVFTAAIVQVMREVSRNEVSRTCRIAWWRRPPSISMCRSSAATDESAPPASRPFGKGKGLLQKSGALTAFRAAVFSSGSNRGVRCKGVTFMGVVRKKFVRAGM
jgi:hypothetical protein